jgi:hypothetical protein
MLAATGQVNAVVNTFVAIRTNNAASALGVLELPPFLRTPGVRWAGPSRKDVVSCPLLTVLNAAARAKSRAKTSAAEQAIRTLVKRGDAVTFQAVCREAGVSHAFLYGHEDLRRRIQHLRDQARPAPQQRAVCPRTTSRVGLRTT